MKYGQDYAQESRLVICTPDGISRYGVYIHYPHKRWLQIWTTPYVPAKLHPKFSLFNYSNIGKFGDLYMWMDNPHDPIQVTTLKMTLYLLNK